MKIVIFIICFIGIASSQDFVVGDVSEDGLLSVYDIVIMIDIIFDDCDVEYSEIAGDIDLSGEIDILDMSIAISLILETWCDNTFYQYQCTPYALDCCYAHSNWSSDTLFTEGTQWNIHSFGYMGSRLWDSWIFSTDNIIATGKINFEHSKEKRSGIRWNGSDWNYFSIHRLSIWDWVLPRAVWSFSPSDIWLGGTHFSHWDGNENHLAEEYPDGGTVESIWGVQSSGHVYFGCTNGSLGFFNGDSVILFDTGSETIFYDMNGHYDESTGEEGGARWRRSQSPVRSVRHGADQGHPRTCRGRRARCAAGRPQRPGA